MKDKKKKFIAPEIEIIDFTTSDIITASDTADWHLSGGDGDDWNPEA